MIITPALWMLLGALLTALLPGKWLRLPLLLAPLVTLWAIWQPIDGSSAVSWLGITLQLFDSSPLRQLFATVFALMAGVGGLYAMQHSSRRELAAALAYAGGAIGVCFSGDLLTFFVFWELMAIFSTVVIWSGHTPAARAAGLRYALLHFLGGVMLMAGIAALAVHGSLEITALNLEQPAAWLILAGVLINAGAPPLGAWVADAYPEASAGGSVMLSAFTTKTAVLALILLFPGASILIVLGPLMVLYGMSYALVSNDVRRLLAYSIVGQVGFMVTAVGIGTELALSAAAAHAFTHILYKGLLMMSAGAVFVQTGEREFTRLGGLARQMPFTATCALVGALTIATVPLTSGYVSKSLISLSVDQAGLDLVALILSFASAAAMVYVGLRLPWFVFFGPPTTRATADNEPESLSSATDPTLNMRWAMGLLALACLTLGIAPTLLFSLLPSPIDADPYSVSKLASTAALLGIGTMVFFLTWRTLAPRPITITDTDWLYRIAGLSLVRGAQSLVQALRDMISNGMRRDTKYAKLLFAFVADEGWLSRPRSVGAMMSVLVGLLLLVVMWI